MAEGNGKQVGQTVAVLGTGIMGSAMAGNLIDAGLTTVVWDRSPSSTAPLEQRGAQVASTAADAVDGASLVITMLPTSAVVEQVIFGQGVVDRFAPGAAWAQMGTIGVRETVDLAERLRRLRPDVLFVDAPVSGSKGPAEKGELLILASGPPEARPVLAPAFAAVGRKTVWLGPAGQGMRMKLTVNAYLSILIEAVAEALELATRLGVDPDDLDQAIEGGPLDAPIADAKLHKMLAGDYAPEFPLEWALKDVNLALEEAGSDSLPVLSALSRQWQTAVAAGHGRQDISAARLGFDSADHPRR
jgi:3-hydroxyisobutyrate dehydrogenase